MQDLDPLESIAASELVSASLLAALIPALVNRGVLTQQDTNEISENALMTLEMQQGADPAVQRVYETARELIDAPKAGIETHPVGNADDGKKGQTGSPLPHASRPFDHIRMPTRPRALKKSTPPGCVRAPATTCQTLHAGYAGYVFFALKCSHQPLGLIPPSTNSHRFGAWKCWHF
jgi:hypothetical protein